MKLLGDQLGNSYMIQEKVVLWTVLYLLPFWKSVIISNK